MDVNKHDRLSNCTFGHKLNHKIQRYLRDIAHIKGYRNFKGIAHILE